jgi:hypothetical protein
MIVQPAAKDPVGKMGLGGDLPRGGNEAARRWGGRTITNNGRATWTSGVEVAEVHVETFYFPSPVTRTPEINHPLRTVAQHPTGVDI